RKNGIRTLTLELEGATVGGQERTRLQAFLESLHEDPNCKGVD
ncbi:MAG: Benzoyl-CoA reductase/2-hydroxyglutaryl-CoA dehydratase subunit, BcrC/BadD/HgdB, partial [Firmicutes bacterium]|nr:Benzoyl-CoA reductase/2-hydroxyglutaryl-CoA dehydratase subunit, BcrC/BadD/HgdB [Bacillota bacterium]